MTPRQIATNQAVMQCDVCGRTLLRGETPAIFLAGGSRRSVCELCTPRATHEGWIREGVAAEELAVRSRGRERRGSFFSRLRARRDGHARRRVEDEGERPIFPGTDLERAREPEPEPEVVPEPEPPPPPRRPVAMPETPREP